jgi:hypothetical protein
MSAERRRENCKFVEKATVATLKKRIPDCDAIAFAKNTWRAEIVN